MAESVTLDGQKVYERHGIQFHSSIDFDDQRLNGGQFVLKIYSEHIESTSDFAQGLTVTVVSMYRRLREKEGFFWTFVEDRENDLSQAMGRCPDVLIIYANPPFFSGLQVVIGPARQLHAMQVELGSKGWEVARWDEDETVHEVVDRRFLEYQATLNADEVACEAITAWHKKYRERQDRLFCADEEKRMTWNRLHFGSLEIRAGEAITFVPTGATYIVGSGEGTADNGGVLVVVPGKGLYSLRQENHLRSD